MKQVYVAADPVDAELMKGRLVASGIDAVVQGAGAFALRGELPMTTDTLPTVWVLDEASLDGALALVDEHRRRRADADAQSGAWTCPRCGERLEPQFTDCWRCDTARPGSV